MKRIAWLALLGFILIVFSDCVTVRPEVAPPPPQDEAQLAKPSPGHVWIAGLWAWKAGRYVWVPGHWVKAHRGRIWIPGHWVKRGRHWVWIKGRWRRA